jgi:hypothetical protein
MRPMVDKMQPRLDVSPISRVLWFTLSGRWTEFTYKEYPAGTVLEAIRFRGYRKDLAIGWMDYTVDDEKANQLPR